MRRGLAFSAVVACASLLVVRPAPSYDPWAWLLWGREVAHGGLDTAAGPAFKPLPVALCALLGLAGSAAPVLWVLVARTGAAVALWLTYRLGRRLEGRGAGAAAVAAVALCGPFLDHAATGLVEPLLVGLALAGVEAWRAGRHRWALAAAVACALLRVETWPFVGVFGMWAWAQRPQDRRLLLGAGVLVPLAWFVPELVGSGDLLRSASRAQVPNPGQPALADVPLWASLRAAASLPLWPLWAGVAALVWLVVVRGHRPSRPALAVAAVGGGWVALVAAMAQAGFSGEARYALPGAALVAAAGAVGLVATVRVLAARPMAPAVAVAALVAAAVVAAAPRAKEVAELRATQAYQWALQADLERAVDAVGGRAAGLRCGRPFVGPLRGPLMAYRLDVAKRVVEPDLAPRAPGVVFRSALQRGGVVEPAAVAGFVPVARVGAWEVVAACAGAPGGAAALG